MLLTVISCAFFDIVLFGLFVFGSNDEYVTFESVIKLKNERTNSRLHSHEVKYSSGSGQQSVTGNKNTDDDNSYWVIKPPMKSIKHQREAVKCDSIIRLQHYKTSKNLHSHDFLSPISGENEVSCFGEKGQGDKGDHWYLKCDTKYWTRGKEVYFQHVDTNRYLTATENRFGRPISGQFEIVATNDLQKYYSKWKTAEGVYFNSETSTDFRIKDEL